MKIEILVKELPVRVREAEGTRFPYIDVGSEVHGRPSFRLWVSGRLVESGDWEEVVRFPARATIVRTERGSLVLRPADGSVVYNVLVECGYRGGSSLEVLAPEGAEVFSYRRFHSPLGSTGISAGALIVAPAGSPVKVKWARSGRLYGGPAEGLSILYPDGREEVLDRLVDGVEEMEALKRLLE